MCSCSAVQCSAVLSCTSANGAGGERTSKLQVASASAGCIPVCSHLPVGEVWVAQSTVTYSLVVLVGVVAFGS